jgi:hypothetical protein
MAGRHVGLQRGRLHPDAVAAGGAGFAVRQPDGSRFGRDLLAGRVVQRRRFEIWRRDGAASDWSLLAQAPSNSESQLDGTVAPGTLYAYKVRAFNAWGHSGFSSESSVATPDHEGGCGFLLRVETADLALDCARRRTNAENSADSRALLAGSLSAWIRSPPGNAHPVRVVLGFRNAQGAAVGTPVELASFYRVPGCPGLAVPAVVPEAFRAPESGTNGLWLEMVVASRDPVEAFTTERHSQESPLRKRLFDVAIRPTVPAARVRVLEGAGVPGGAVAVPVEMVSTGGELRVAFSVGYGSGLVCTGIQAGADAPQVLAQAVPDTNGAVGVMLQAPAENPFGAGAKHVATLQFLAEEPGDYVLRVQDEPIARDIDGRGTGIQWEDGRIAVAAAGFEGDVYPRPHGDGAVDDEDVHLALLFALGVETPLDAREFQRLDCAPLETCGDGRTPWPTRSRSSVMPRGRSSSGKPAARPIPRRVACADRRRRRSAPRRGRWRSSRRKKCCAANPSRSGSSSMRRATSRRWRSAWRSIPTPSPTGGSSSAARPRTASSCPTRNRLPPAPSRSA